MPSEAADDARPRRRFPRWWFGVPSSAILVEVGAALVWLLTAQECFSYAQMEARRQTLIQSELPAEQRRQPEPEAFMDTEVLHPYAGYLPDPSTRGDHGEQAPWPNAEALFETIPPDAVRIVITGGSVAGQVLVEFDNVLEERGYDLERTHFVDAAGGGYKQPQQLAIITYLLAAGAHIDLVVNVDGFNEAVLPRVENHPTDVSSLYPRGWSRRFPDVDDMRLVDAVARVDAWRQRRRDAASMVSDSWLRRSVTANVVWSAWDANAAEQLTEARGHLDALRPARSYQRNGPRPPATASEALREGAETWARSSLLLSRLAEANGFRYLHFLQPNQYVEGSKPFSEEERARFVRPDTDYGTVAPLGYQALLERVPQLVEAGVPIHDLTQLFEADPQTLYMDECCHFNEEGRLALTRHIVEVIAETLPLQTVSRRE
ncbi:MAG: hypothetical protein AB8I08_22565 [Sandaracinaceae bacterium]